MEWFQQAIFRLRHQAYENMDRATVWSRAKDEDGWKQLDGRHCLIPPGASRGWRTESFNRGRRASWPAIVTRMVCEGLTWQTKVSARPWSHIVL